MYTGKSIRTKDRYKYNFNKIININPNYLKEGASGVEAEEKLRSNCQNLINSLGEQLTDLQKLRIELLYSDLGQPDFYLNEIKDSLIEIRYEGAGWYVNGYGLNNYDSGRSNLASIDFSDFGGDHRDGDKHPANYCDGIGVYGAMAIVVRRCEIMGIFFRASTLPDDMFHHDTVAPGVYSFKVGTHPSSGGYKALNLYMLNDFSYAGRTLPNIKNMPGSPNPGVTGVNSHKGWNNYRGSEGCQTICQSDGDYNDYISLFNSGEKGYFHIARHVQINI